MTINEDIASYEVWLRRQCRVVQADLLAKHERMRKSPFDFLRASYFRWAKTIATTCPGYSDAPKTLCVGDIHVENFGTWRDAQARLVWGINDFDEAATMPYAYDLIRLATSARLAPTLLIDREEAAGALLKGYLRGLEDPHPMLLDEHAHWLRPLVGGGPNASRKFWDEVDGYPEASPPAPVRKALERHLPKDAQVLGYVTRTKGGGSLGRPRFLVVATWQGGRLVREAKALVPSAWHWARSRSSPPIRFLELAFGAYRSPDPSLSIRAGYALRPVAPDAHKVELADVAGQGLGAKLITAMGAELAAVHAGYKRRRQQILEDVHKRKSGWLHSATEAAERSVRQDFEALLPPAPSAPARSEPTPPPARPSTRKV